MNQVVQESKETFVSLADMVQYGARTATSKPIYLALTVLGLLLVLNKGKLSIGKAVKLG